MSLPKPRPTASGPAAKELADVDLMQRGRRARALQNVPRPILARISSGVTGPSSSRSVGAVSIIQAMVTSELGARKRSWEDICLDALLEGDEEDDVLEAFDAWQHDQAVPKRPAAELTDDGQAPQAKKRKAQ